MTLCTNDSVSLEKKRWQLNETMSNENIHVTSQSDILLKENPSRNTFNNEAIVVQGPTGDNNEI